MQKLEAIWAKSKFNFWRSKHDCAILPLLAVSLHQKFVIVRFGWLVFCGHLEYTR